MLNLIDPAKDADGLHPVNLGKLVLNEKAPLPCTPHGIVVLLRQYGVEIAGRGSHRDRPRHHGRARARAAADQEIGERDGDLVPHRDQRHRGAYPRRRHRRGRRGRAGLLTADMVKPGAAVLDVGITRTEAGLVGDVAPDVAAVAGYLAPNPGGVGPMTRAMLLANVVELAERRPRVQSASY